MLFALLIASSHQALDAPLNASALDGATVAVTVADESGKILFDRNGRTRVVPGSNQKLLTGAFALYELGTKKSFETRIWKLADKTVVDAEGDPLLSYNELSGAARSLQLDRRLPLEVRQAFAPGVPPGWQEDYLKDRYGAKVTAFSIDQGAFELKVEGRKVWLTPDSYGVKIVAEAGRKSTSYDINGKVIRIPADEKLRAEDTLAVPDPSEAASLVLADHTVVSGKIPEGPPSLTLSHTLEQVLPACLKPSDNNMAEHLLLLGASHLGPLPAEGTYSEAVSRLKKFLTRVVGTAPDACLPYDGSGLSRQNLVTTQSITQLLAWEARSEQAAFWKQSLAAAGESGTLRKRLVGIPFRGKTGSLNRVAALSGYLTTKSGKQLIVSIVVNNYSATDSVTRGAMDEFVAKLFREM